MKIIEINCCYECPHLNEHPEGYNGICLLANKPVEEKGELCPPSWCPLPDDEPKNNPAGYTSVDDAMKATSQG